MTTIRFDCDRCGQPVEGIHTRSGTAGFYVVDGSAWRRLRRPGSDEHFVCEPCIQSMPSYRKAYRLDEGAER